MLTDNEMPALYQAANSNSMSAQRTFFFLTKLRLGGLLLAAAGGGLPGSLGGALSLLGFFVALVVELVLLRQRPERTWWEGRAVAESAKTLAWRFAVGGEPFPVNASPQEAEEEFIRQLRETREGLQHAAFVPEDRAVVQITDAMRHLRQQPLEARKQAYLDGRIIDQANWYSDKSRVNDRQARKWMLFLIAVEVAGVIGALARLLEIIHIDLFGLAAAAVAAGATWLQAKQHENLAKAYSVAAQELGEAATQLEWQQQEEHWASFVDDAEQAISREHTRWSAQRGLVLG